MSSSERRGKIAVRIEEREESREEREHRQERIDHESSERLES